MVTKHADDMEKLMTGPLSEAVPVLRAALESGKLARTAIFGDALLPITEILAKSNAAR